MCLQLLIDAFRVELIIKNLHLYLRVSEQQIVNIVAMQNVSELFVQLISSYANYKTRYLRTMPHVGHVRRP